MCASQAMHPLLGLLKIIRRHELVGKCKSVSSWHAKLQPVTACTIIIVLIASRKAQRSFVVWPLGCASHAVHHLLGLLARARRHELVGECNLMKVMACKLEAINRLHNHYCVDC
jgi:hypothetical protein